jgi:EmrB/QacA subfamily drug resistance transporter
MDRKWWTLIAVCVGTFMLLLDVTIVNVALPAIQSSLKANFSDLQWVVDAYSLLLAALLLTTGSLADLYGRKRVFVIGLIIFSLSSLASGLAQSPLWLNLARAAQGIGGAAMFSTSLALLGSAFQGRERGTAFGVWGAITGLAVAIGPVVGGALTTAISWRWIFLVNVPIGVVAVVLTMMRVEESRQPGKHRIDPIGVVTFTGSLGALVYALIKANEKGWGSPLIIGLLIGSAVGLILFVIAELVQKDRAMFDLALFRKPTFTGGSIAAFSLSAGFFALFLYLTLYLQDVLGYSAMQTGLRFLVLSGGILLTSTLAGRLTAFVPIRFLIAPGLLLVGVGLLLMRGVHAGTHWEHLIPGFVVAGAGVGLINPPLASTAIGVVTPDRAGMASGINSTFRQVGIATGIAGLGTLFAHTVSTHIESALRGAAGVSTQAAHALAQTVSQGSGAASGLGALPAKARPVAAHAVRASFTAGLNDVFLVGALLALVSAVLTLLLIRSKDFESGAARGGGRPEPAGEASGNDAEHPPPAAEPQPAPTAPATPEPIAPGATGNQLLRGAEAVIAASGEASRDYERQVEDEIERHRAAELAHAEAQSRVLLSDAMDRSDRYAESLRRRLQELGGERERLVAELREQTDTVVRQADEAAVTRSQLYRVIGQLGSFDADRSTPPAVEGSGNGGRPNGDGSGTEAPSSPRSTPEA